MISKRWPLSLLLGAPILLLPSKRLEAESFDFEFQAGQTEVSTKKFQEIAKRGYVLNAMALKYWAVPQGELGLGLGVMTTKVEGKDSSRGITQDLSLNLLSLDLRYLYAVNSAFSVGPVLRGTFGRGAKYSVQANDDVDLLFAPGFMARYAFKNMNYQPALSFHYNHDANVAKRDVQSFLFGVSITTDFSQASPSVPVLEAAPVPPSPLSDPASAPLPTAPAEGAVPTIIEIKPLPEQAEVATEAAPADAATLETLTFHFMTGSSRLNGISRERAKELGTVLVDNAALWSKIYISAHSDKSGDAQMNKDLSQRRADAFCDALAKRGVPRRKMRCESLDSQRLLPGLPDNAEEHRRIEVVFEDFDKTQVEKLRREIQKALQL